MQEPSDREILEMEQRRYRHPGAKSKAIRDELGLSDVRFHQRLAGIVAEPSPDVAVEFGPLILRCRRRMEQRRAG